MKFRPSNHIVLLSALSIVVVYSIWVQHTANRIGDIQKKRAIERFETRLKTLIKNSSPQKYHILVFADPEASKRYRPNTETLRCYASIHNHTFQVQDAEHPNCSDVEQFFFRRLCAAYQYMHTIPSNDYILALDGDNAVVNNKHRISKWTQGMKDVYFYHRFHNNEVAASSYMIRNTQYGRQFLRDWYSLHHGRFHLHGYSGMNSDNGALHWLLGQRIPQSMPAPCESLGRAGRDYYGFVACIQRTLAKSCQSDAWNHIHIYPHAKGWTHDGWVVNYRWSNSTFMHHAMKNPPIQRNEFGHDYDSYIMPKRACKDSFIKDSHYVEEDALHRLLHQAANKLKTHRQHLGYDENSCVLKLEDE